MSAQPIRRALLSVSDKTGIEVLAQALQLHRVEILSTGGTYRTLIEAGIPVTEVSHHTGFPEMMDGRVKTLHPRIHGGLLYLRDDPEHCRQAEQHHIEAIDLVVVNLYPFEHTAAREDATLAELIENIDIGGPSMLRSAAKNHASVTVITDPCDYDELISQMDAEAGSTTAAFRAACARKVFRVTARYDALIATELTARATAEATAAQEAMPSPMSEILPQDLPIGLGKLQDLRYGENPHQRAAFYCWRQGVAAGLAGARQLAGKELSYNNIMDADAAWRLVGEFDLPACAVIKHANPCGCAIATTQVEAFRRAWDGDPTAAFGSIIAVNGELELATAEALCEPGRFVEVIVAAAFSADAVQLLTSKPKWRNSVRLVMMGTVAGPDRGRLTVRQVLGGLLVQESDGLGYEVDAQRVVSARQPSEDELRDLRVAWLCAKHLASNAISLVREGMLVGAGAGQMSRVTSTRLAVQLAGERARGSVLGSDAFFPFPDGVTTAAEAGVTAIIQPGGSKGDDAVIAEADRHGLAMVFTGVRHFRH